MNNDELYRMIMNSLRMLVDNLPLGEVDEDRVGHHIDHENQRIVLDWQGSEYWLEWDCTVRQRGGVLTYFKNGVAYTSPPPSEN